MDLNHRITVLQAVPLNARAHLLNGNAGHAFHDAFKELTLNASISDTLFPISFNCNNKKYILMIFCVILGLW